VAGGRASRPAWNASAMMPLMLNRRFLRAIATVSLIAGIVVSNGCSRNDQGIQMAVDALLAADTATATLDIDIRVTDRVVSLEGAVLSREQQRRAVEIARGVRGVSDVIDALYLNDAVVVEAVKKTLAADPLVGTIPIAVDAQHGNIRLMSDQTNKQERVRAVEISSKVDGVKHVEDRMR
jgi:osmotically-inducible protein OsmY